MCKESVCKECGDVSEFKSIINKLEVCEDCLNIIVNEKLDKITSSRPRRKPDGDKGAWVQECNDVLTKHGFAPEYLWCRECERPTSHVELEVDGVNSQKCLACDYRRADRRHL